MGKQQDFSFRLVGFREVWDLLDLSQYDKILEESFKRMEDKGKIRSSNRTHERRQEGKIEIFQRDNRSIQQQAQTFGRELNPISESSDDQGKSLGIMTVKDAELKFS